MFKKNEDGLWTSIVKGLKEIVRLELKTDSGKINLIVMIGLLIICGVLTAKDWVLKAIQMVGGFWVEKETGKVSAILYEPTNTYVLLAFLIIPFIFCVLTIRTMEKSIEKVNEEDITDTK